MDTLVVEEKDALFDRGYVDYKKFDSYCKNSTRFVSRIKNNALVEVIKEFPLKPQNNIKKDQLVYLGKDKITKMKDSVRLIETEDNEGKPVIIITNDFKLDVEKIGAIYRRRWQIELFFKWIKQHFSVKNFYGISQQAVKNQLLIALTTYCLLILLKLKTGYTGPLLTIKRLFAACLYEPFSSFVKKLYHKEKSYFKDRRRINHELIFQETERQVLAGETDHLNDLTY
ncbi:MAG: putative transposase, partial [Clostridia bacterium]|nr:putative transposase [Clostridia bacterium]